MKEIYVKSEQISKRDESVIKNYLESLGLKVTRLDSKRSKVKLPDYRVDTQDGFSFYCEVKTIINDINEFVSHELKMNKIQKKIEQSYKQFSSINKNNFAANVLFLLSEDFRINENTFIEFMRGYVDVFTEKIDTKKHRDGNAYIAVRNIDIYIWFSEESRIYMFVKNEDYKEKFERIFKIDVKHRVKI